MSARYFNVAFTDGVRRAQSRYGSRTAFARREAHVAPASIRDPLTADERAFIAERDGFYLATAGETGWPYIQFRGGPTGFLRVLDDHTIGWADFRGNRQYISTGNMSGNDRVALFLMDYPHQARLKIFGRARIVDVAEDPDLTARLSVPDYAARVERAVLVTVEAYDWNCQQHITPRYTSRELHNILGRF